jgi:alpha-galactosidase
MHRRTLLAVPVLLSLASAAVYAGAAGILPTTAPARDNSVFILTPPAPDAPRINGPSLFGVRANHPVLYRIPATGKRPMVFSAHDLPAGVTIDADTGELTGAIAADGTYKIVLHAKNAVGSADRAFRLVVGDAIAITPPLGWNSYNIWSDQINEDRELAAAKGIVSTGLIDHGWTYVNMDDGWQSTRGGDLKALQPDPRKFTDIKAMVDQIHQMGLKAGLYSSPWVMTYAGRLGSSAENPDGTAQRWPPGAAKNKKTLPFAIGQFKFMTNDAKQFAAWGFDYLKYDWGPVEFSETREMYDALRDQNRDIVFSISNNHVQNMFADIGNVSAVANCWRTTTDITDNWGRISTDIGFNQDKWAPFARPGHYNDADMLVVGVVGWGAGKSHPSKLTPDEQYTHISLWAMLSSPMILGCDLTKMDPFTLSLLSNDEVLAVDQDALVKQAVNVSRQGQLEVYRKELEDGTLAVGLFNRGPAAAPVIAQWSDLKLSGKQTVRDLWRQKDLGVFDQSFSANVASHGVVLMRVIPAK